METGCGAESAGGGSWVRPGVGTAPPVVGTRQEADKAGTRDENNTMNRFQASLL